MRRSWIERSVERRVHVWADELEERRRTEEEAAERRMRRVAAMERAQAYAPGPYRRAIGGELIEEIVGVAARTVSSVWKGGR